MKIANKDQVPQYLQKGSFFEALDADDEEGFDVPSDCLKVDVIIRSDEELRHLLHSLRFWGVYMMPMEVLIYVMKSPEKSYDSLLMDFPEFKEHLSKILDVKASTPKKVITKAIELSLGVEIVTVLHEQMGFALFVENQVTAIRVDDLQSLIYFQAKVHHTLRVPNTDTLKFAALHGSMKCLRYARLQGCNFSADVLVLAITHGHKEAVKFLYDECGMAYTAQTMMIAAHYQSSNLALFQYLHESECPWDENVPALLAERNGLECLKFVRENGCPWDSVTCITASCNGHLQCLQYAHKQGCPMNKKVMALAVENAHVHCLAYACENNCPMPFAVVLSAVWCRSWQCLQYLLLHVDLCCRRVYIAMFAVSYLLHTFCNQCVPLTSFRTAIVIQFVERAFNFTICITPSDVLDCCGLTKERSELVQSSLWILSMTIYIAGVALVLLLKIVDVVLFLYETPMTFTECFAVIWIIVAFLMRFGVV